MVDFLIIDVFYLKMATRKLLQSKAVLKEAFSRAAILSNEKFRGVRLNLSSGELKITANNPEQEEAEENR